jgi:hypothetical protein
MSFWHCFWGSRFRGQVKHPDNAPVQVQAMNGAPHWMLERPLYRDRGSRHYTVVQDNVMPCLWPAHLVTVLHRMQKHSSRSQFMLCSHPILAGMLPSALQEDDTMLVYWLNLQLNSGWIKKPILSPRESNLLSCLHACRLWRSVLFLCSQTL